jgi:hypothetical protein
MSMDPGKYGATKISWDADSPRYVVRDLARKNPKASKAKLLTLYRDAVREDEGIFNADTKYCFTNAYNAMNGDDASEPVRTRASKSPEEVEAARAERTEKAAKLDAVYKERVVEMVMLDLFMPNGEMLRDCTFKEVAKFGGNFTKLSRMGKPTQRVGILTEAKVRAAFK